MTYGYIALLLLGHFSILVYKIQKEKGVIQVKLKLIDRMAVIDVVQTRTLALQPAKVFT